MMDSSDFLELLRALTHLSSTLNIPSYERGVARVLGYDLPP